MIRTAFSTLTTEELLAYLFVKKEMTELEIELHNRLLQAVAMLMDEEKGEDDTPEEPDLWEPVQRQRAA